MVTSLLSHMHAQSNCLDNLGNLKVITVLFICHVFRMKMRFFFGMKNRASSFIWCFRKISNIRAHLPHLYKVSLFAIVTVMTSLSTRHKNELVCAFWLVPFPRKPFFLVIDGTGAVFHYRNQRKIGSCQSRNKKSFMHKRFDPNH